MTGPDWIMGREGPSGLAWVTGALVTEMRSQKVGLFEVSHIVDMFQCKEAVGLPGKTCGGGRCHRSGCEIVWRAGVIE